MHRCYKNNILDILEYYKIDITDQKRLKTAQKWLFRAILSLKSKLTAINGFFWRNFAWTICNFDKYNFLGVAQEWQAFNS